MICDDEPREREKRFDSKRSCENIYGWPIAQFIYDRFAILPHSAPSVPHSRSKSNMCETHIPSTHIMQSDPHSTMMKHYIARSMIVTIYTLIARVFGIGNYVSRKHRLWCIGYLTDCNWDNVSDSKIYSVDVRRLSVHQREWRIKPYDSVRAWNSNICDFLNNLYIFKEYIVCGEC